MEQVWHACLRTRAARRLIWPTSRGLRPGGQDVAAQIKWRRGKACRLPVPRGGCPAETDRYASADGGDRPGPRRAADMPDLRRPQRLLHPALAWRVQRLRQERRPLMPATDYQQRPSESAGGRAELCLCPCLCWRDGAGPGASCVPCSDGQHGRDAVAAQFPGVPSAAHQARDFARAALGPGHPAADTVDLLMTELFANAISHSRSGQPGGTVTVSVQDACAAPGPVVVTVRDEGAASGPRIAGSGSESEHGRGLRLVHELADDWGTAGGQAARMVWFSCGAGRREMRAAGDGDAGKRCGSGGG